MKSLEAMFYVVVMTMLCQSAANARMYGQLLCKEKGYHCQRVKSGQTWYSLWPNPNERNIVRRINRMNTQLYAGIKLAVPDDLGHVDLMDLSPFLKQIQAPGEKMIVVDPEVLAWAAYDSSGRLVRWGPVSAGRDYCNDIDETCRTHEGEYRIYSLGSSDCFSRKFPLPDGGAPMPYCMYFNGGQALHGEPNGLPGYHDSHGCVRLYVNDAEWLRYSFVEPPNDSNGYRGTLIIVGTYDKPNPHEEPQDDEENNDSHSDMEQDELLQ